MDTSRSKQDIKKSCKEFWMDSLSDLEFNQLIYQSAKNNDQKEIQIEYELEEEDAKKVIKLCKDSDMTIYVYMLSVLESFLYQYTSKSDLYVTSPVLENENQKIPNTHILIRNHVSGSQTFKEVLLTTRNAVSDAYKNQAYPVFDYVKKLNSDDYKTDLLYYSKNLHKNFDRNIQNVNLAIEIEKVDQKLRVIFASTGAYSKSELEQIKACFSNTLHCCVSNLMISVKEINLLTEEEKKQIVTSLNSNNTELKETTIKRLFEKIVNEHANEVAVVAKQKQLTYTQLNAKANQIARLLREALVGKDDIVGLIATRSVDTIVGIVAIIKAGAAYLPLDESYPKERIDYILENSNAKALLVPEGINIQTDFQKTILSMDDSRIEREDDEDLEELSTYDSLAYVIYTSGSTGNPKGVMIEQRNVIHLIHGLQEAVYKEYQGHLQVALIASFAFDASVQQIFASLLFGHTLHITQDCERKDGDYLLQFYKEHKIDISDGTPTHLSLIANATESVQDIKVRHYIIGGEALPYQFIEMLRVKYDYSMPIVTNVYGTTECCVDSTYYRIEANTTSLTNIMSIGKPIDNAKLYILSKDRSVLPIGSVGEIYIGGTGCSRGYLNLEEMTQERFIDDPFQNEGRMYQTGDLGRWNEEGNIEYIGRIDQQVKIRGYRIELAEIEKQILKQKNVKEAVVLDMEDQFHSNYLCSFVVCEGEVEVNDIIEKIRKHLPDYMIPSVIQKIDAIPMTLSGKVDRKKIASLLNTKDSIAGEEEPQNEVEETIKGLWLDNLRVDHIGVCDNYFHCGGHSLRGAMLVNKINQTFHSQITLREIFEYPTIRQLAQYMIQLKDLPVNKNVEVQQKDQYEATSAQKRLYVLSQIDSVGVSYNMTSTSIIKGKISAERFDKIFNELIKRHESLRTSFFVKEGIVYQKINEDATLEEFEKIDGQGKDVEKILSSWIRPFDLKKAPLMRVCLIQTGEQEHILACDTHHIVSDGVSLSILMQEFVALLSEHTLPLLGVQFKNYSEWYNELVLSEEMKRQEEYWKSQFQGEIPVLDLPSDYQRPTVQSYEGNRILFSLKGKAKEALHNMQGTNQTTLFMILLAAYNVFLMKYTGQEDIIVGSPISGRQNADSEQVVGMFTNTLAFRNYPTRDMTFLELLSAVKENVLGGLLNQNYQFETLVEELDLTKDLSRNPLFDTMFVMQNMEKVNQTLGEIEFIPYSYRSKAAKFDLTLEAAETEEEIEFEFEYCTKLFKEETIQRMARHLLAILETIASNPNQRLKDIQMLSEDEAHKIVAEFNQTKKIFPENICIHEMFEQQVVKTPKKTAVIFENETLSYQELNERSNQIARKLIANGVKNGQIVGIMLNRSFAMMIGILGILKAGGAYMPIDPNYPKDRKEFMLNDSAANVLVTTSQFAQNVNYSGILFNMDQEDVDMGDASNLNTKVNARDLAYVIYTSGSTGKPKGVMLEHRGAINRILWMRDHYDIGENDVILQKTPFTFDVSVWELFLWFFAGAKVCFLEPGGEKDPAMMMETIEKNRITTMHFVPSMLNAFLAYTNTRTDLHELASLKQVFASGEALSVKTVNQFNQKLYEPYGTQLHNLYGPTEATVDVSYFDCSTKNSLGVIPIGKPIDNIQLFILNEDRQIQPILIPGELCISGVGVARGYLNREELTGEKFVSNPYLPGELMYRTGDVARWLPDGNIEYLGRMDHQIKIRGFRIETGEIETQLLKHEGIKEAIVVDYKDAFDNKYLCAYYTSNYDITLEDLKASVLKNLPEYMVPAYFQRLEKMPLTANGKLDRKQLPKPEDSVTTQTEYVAQRNETEDDLVKIWEKVLNKSRVGIRDNFFQIGGNSILLIHVLELLEKKYAGKVTITDLFLYPTIETLAKFLMKEEKETIAIELDGVDLDETYLSEVDLTEKATYDMTITPELFDRMKRLATKEGTSYKTILLSSYLQLFAEISNQDSITIYMDSNDQTRPITIDVGAIDDSPMLLQAVISKVNNKEIVNFSTEVILKRKDEQSKGIIPLFLMERSAMDPSELYDVILQVEETAQRASLRFINHTGRINQEKFEEMLKGYYKILEYTINECEQLNP